MPENSNPSYEELLDAHRKLGAEHHNYRERAERDNAQAFRRGTEHVYTALLPVLDGLNAAQLHGDLEHLPAGVQTLLAGLMSALEDNGLYMFGDSGDVFDPELHDAVQMRQAPGVDCATVDEVIQCGFRTSARVLRPAKVVVVTELATHSKK